MNVPTADGTVRMLLLTSDVDEPGTVQFDTVIPYHLGADGIVYWNAPCESGLTFVLLNLDPTGLPSGVVHQRPDGSEVLRTIDGYRLEVDTGHGVAVFAPNGQRRSVTGIFLVKP
ncbi:hypothetical protein QRX50_35445 [Amycolatopsis carbonis]|uniref:Uncharacterized protein n=1 Tax=Amycolatopsis carbonis TaxID=715471 RepID=A0A9Y2IB82_9PSEU|nr:hypothetical protein [Amycolatopsis sp. 2-15]WIX76709.1 hypothetical protein QRX50_35445 [Amycolatopsis sp. 2-15]